MTDPTAQGKEITDAEIEALIWVKCGYCGSLELRERICECGLCQICEAGDIHE